jgi:hypothetical protein
MVVFAVDHGNLWGKNAKHLGDFASISNVQFASGERGFKVGHFGDLIQGIIIWLVFALIFMLILRELWCWYFKLNKMVSLLTEIRDSLKMQASETVIVPNDLREAAGENNHRTQREGGS